MGVDWELGEGEGKREVLLWVIVVCIEIGGDGKIKLCDKHCALVAAIN